MEHFTQKDCDEMAIENHEKSQFIYPAVGIRPHDASHRGDITPEYMPISSSTLP